MEIQDYSQGIEIARNLFDDLKYGYASDWKKQDSSRKIIGFLPIYIPREIIHAAGMLPVGLFGAGDRIPVVRGDAYFQSYICHLPRTVVEMALGGHLDNFDGFIFPAICDVIRNLSGIFRLQHDGKYVRYLDFPQNFEWEVGGIFYKAELQRLINDLEKINGVKITPENLNRSIQLYNRNRELIQELDIIRSESPHKLSAVDYYLILRAGNVMTIEDHNDYLARMIPLASAIECEVQDKIRVIIQGSFCEQPPIGLIKTIENSGCYIIDEDFQLGLKWFNQPLDDSTDNPLDVLVKSYLTSDSPSAAVYEGDNPRAEKLAQTAKDLKADGVLFCAPSFCDPALLDRPMQERAMDRHHIKHSSFQYHENLGQFHVIKEQAGTFADMIKLWE